ncbi:MULTISPECIES: hypothetical protein [Methylobacterium]|uniref:Rap1a immunity protein domain-containing protein n=1 Tax=Methylobacterium isbiliense TaxID=315478 RepID=A0ABQ4SAB0_9HYPH|nr:MULTISPECIES: hypothetical protein [Methylobacterium]MBY0297656.1 hypothetical protein [Methylobacterium sp.]MDN3625748.1 hypothetical protein [Methylobacterium isbiliense]GJD98727.1 hypothetical protein GMJLKIPL_0638 [Methylobacterium isbiliense]
MIRLVGLALAFGAGCAFSAAAETDKIVGVGAVSCAQFSAEIARTPSAERDFLAWAQGFMSGALIRSPPGVDEGLDLAPPSFPLPRQAAFLRDHCATHPEQDYMDAVHALYRTLRTPPT